MRENRLNLNEAIMHIQKKSSLLEVFAATPINCIPQWEMQIIFTEVYEKFEAFILHRYSCFPPFLPSTFEIQPGYI